MYKKQDNLVNKVKPTVLNNSDSTSQKCRSNHHSVLNALNSAPETSKNYLSYADRDHYEKSMRSVLNGEARDLSYTGSNKLSKAIAATEDSLLGQEGTTTGRRKEARGDRELLSDGSFNCGSNYTLTEPSSKSVLDESKRTTKRKKKNYGLLFDLGCAKSSGKKQTSAKTSSKQQPKTDSSRRYNGSGGKNHAKSSVQHLEPHNIIFLRSVIVI